MSNFTVNEIVDLYSRQRVLRFTISVFVFVISVVAFSATDANAQIATMPAELAHVGVNEQLNHSLPLDTMFRDHQGRHIRFGDLFDGKRPIVLMFAYHSCPVLCSMVINAAASGLRGIGWTIGKEFDVVTVSIDPEESLEKASSKRSSILTEYGAARGHDGRGWHFLLGDKLSIQALTQATGFEYQYDAEQKQWAHPSVIMIATPDGRLARYLYGLEFSPTDLKLGLLEASRGKSISTVEKLILYCYHYDPKGGKYVLLAQRVMQLGGALVALVLFGFLGVFWGRELRKKNNAKRVQRDAADAQNTAVQDVLV